MLMILFMGANMISCSPQALTDEVEEVATEGEDGEIGGEDEGGGK